MHAFSASELLDAWERAVGQPPAWRALILLEAAGAGPPEQLAELSVGRRDARLLALRQQTLGPQLTSLSTCPACGAQLELSFMASDLLTNPAPNMPSELTAQIDGYDICFRLPNSLDLIAVAGARDLRAGREILLDRCILHARHHSNEVRPGELPQRIAEAVAAQMAEADPLANLDVATTCPACGNQWRPPFDIESFFWTEINIWATRILHDVHVLASAYGWHEADILRMSARRRQYYLNLVGG